MAELSLSQGKKALVDDELFDWLNQSKWTYQKIGRAGYAVQYTCGGRRGRKRVYLHRILMGAPDGVVVDHINHCGLDNRLENLRVCSYSQNSQNRKGVVGYRKHPTGLWQAYIRRDGKMITKYFHSKVDAILWRKLMEKQLFGEFAYRDNIEM